MPYPSRGYRPLAGCLNQLWGGGPATAEKPEFRGLAPSGPLLSGGILGRGVAVGLRKADKDLKAAFDAAIDAALADGTIRRLSERWFTTDISPRS